jgi:hypothetical protein
MRYCTHQELMRALEHTHQELWSIRIRNLCSQWSIRIMKLCARALNKGHFKHADNMHQESMRALIIRIRNL